MLWNGFNFKADFLDSENIIAKIHLLLQLERSDPYSHRDVSTMSLSERIKTSLAYVPEKHRPYVLALFANTIYFPKQFSHAVLQHLMNNFLASKQIKLKEIGNQCLILEQDPTGIVNEFLRRNAIQGRLDKKTFQRTQQVKAYVELVTQQIKHTELKNDGLDDLTVFLNRKYWVILADNSLSGTSLCSDLKKLMDLAITNGKRPTIVLLVRTLTSVAQNKIKDLFTHYDFETSIDFGLLLDRTLTITPDSKRHCIFFNRPKTFEGVIEACKWLAEQEAYKTDSDLLDHKKNSKGDGTEDQYDMAFGFKYCGLTFVSSENCPSDSLPLLWYSNPNIYISPFPRVLSRIGKDGSQGEVK